MFKNIENLYLTNQHTNSGRFQASNPLSWLHKHKKSNKNETKKTTKTKKSKKWFKIGPFFSKNPGFILDLSWIKPKNKPKKTKKKINMNKIKIKIKYFETIPRLFRGTIWDFFESFDQKNPKKTSLPVLGREVWGGNNTGNVTDIIFFLDRGDCEKGRKRMSF